jgi:diguanylate cyclase (GGDEF)-like protein/PAS domain S-box-containing protein
MTILPPGNHPLVAVLTSLQQQAKHAIDALQFAVALVDRLQAALEVDCCEILAISMAEQSFNRLASTGLSLHSNEPTPFVPGSQLDYMLHSQEPVIVEDLARVSYFAPLPQLLDREIVSSLNVLVVSAEQVFGVLSLHCCSQRSFTTEEVLLLQASASLLSSVISQERVSLLHSEIERVKSIQQNLEDEITICQRIEAVLRHSEERYAVIANATTDGVWDWDLQTNEIYFSPCWKSMLGYGEHEIGNQLDEWFIRLHPDDRDIVQHEIDRFRAGLTSTFESQHRLLHQDGTYRWILNRGLLIRDAADTPYRLVGAQTDITTRKVGEEQLLFNALHDGLTGLANRTLFIERLEHSISLARRHEDSTFAVIFFDLDRFKVINDSLGHVTGDQLLITIAHRLKGCLRSSDTCARLGGDEFAILLEHIQDNSEVIRIVERMQQILKTPFVLNNQEVFVNASIGVILNTAGYETPEDLIRDVDTAMYRAKAMGRGRYEIFTQEMHEHAVSLLQLETDLRRAIARKEFLVVYQPVMELRTGKITGFEALVRWQQPERGLISPADFIPIAEETGLILPIGRWVLHEACRQMREWHQQYPTYKALTISVNMSRKQLSQPDLMQQVQQILDETGLEPRCLKLEITESAIMEDIKLATSLMQQLKTLGVQIVMDDFGTGYSSLSHLHLFPIDTLKIDPSFVHKADTDLEKVEIIRTVISLAWNLGIDVVAEGIETKRQMSQLKLLKCDLAQGYLFSRPLSSEAATDFLTRQLDLPKSQ